MVEAARPFCEFLSTIATIFPDLDQVQDKFTIVFTKAPSNTNASKLSNSLKTKFLNPTSNGAIDNYYGSPEKRIKCKTIIEHFVKNPDKIGVFVRPDIAGPIEDKVINPDNNISKTILRSGQVSSSQLENVKIGAHPDSITFVKENLKTIGEYYKSIVQSKVKTQIELSLSRIEDAYKKGNYQKLLDIRSELVKIQKFVVEEKNSRKALESLCKMNEVSLDGELISFSETIKYCTAMLKKGIGEPTLDDLLLIQLSLQLNAVSTKLQINQARYLRDQGNLDKLTCDKLIEEATKKAAQVESKLHDVEKEMVTKSTTLRQIGEGALELGAKALTAAGGVLLTLLYGVVKPIADAYNDIEKADGFLETTGAVAKGVVYAIPRAVSGLFEGVTEGVPEMVRGVDLKSSPPERPLFIDFSIPNTDGASSSGTYNCILGMEYENEILNYPEVLKVLTDSLAINYSDVLDKVGGFDQEFVREACLSGNVELLEECFGN
jgi:hypothetical protein